MQRDHRSVTKTDVPITWLSSDGCGCPADSSESARVVSAAHVSSWWDDVDGDVSWFQGLTWGSVRERLGMCGEVLACCLNFS